ncbi:MAG TPA: DUF2058 domain-containing protein [Arenimonas sp.]|nr:DUF2058 domain-containing protein [Arenimonas sp.]
MAKASPLQEQLLKAGLVKQSKVAQVAREQSKARQGKGPPQTSEIQQEAERARLEKAERDRAIEAERKAQARLLELRAQARQIVEDRKVPRSGEIEYRFSVDGVIRNVLVNNELRQKLASGALLIARVGERFELLPRSAGEQVRERDASLIVLDHGQPSQPAATSSSADDEAYYARFAVPDDLVW